MEHEWIPSSLGTPREAPRALLFARHSNRSDSSRSSSARLGDRKRLVFEGRVDVGELEPVSEEELAEAARRLRLGNGDMRLQGVSWVDEQRKTHLVDSKVDVAHADHLALEQTTLNPGELARRALGDHKHLEHLLLANAEEARELVGAEGGVQTEEGAEGRGRQLGLDGREEEGELVSGGVGEGRVELEGGGRLCLVGRRVGRDESGCSVREELLERR